MKFCPECGHKLREEQGYCHECGRSVTVIGGICEYNDTEESLTGMDRPGLATVNSLSWVRVFEIIILLLLMGIGMLYSAGSYFTGKSYTAGKIEEAMDEGDAEKLARYIYSEDEELRIDKKGVEAFLRMAGRDKDFKSSLIASLRQGKSYKCFSITDKGKRLGVFTNYLMEVEPQFLRLASNCEGADILVEGEYVGKTDKVGNAELVGPFMPGIYRIEVVLDNEYGTARGLREVELQKEEISLFYELDVKYVSLLSRVEGLKLLAGGQKSGTVLKKGNNKLGPISGNSEAVLIFYKEYSWGRLLSREYKVKDMYYNGELKYFQLKNSDFVKSAAVDLRAFLESFYNARGTMDTGKIVNATDNCREEFKKTYMNKVSDKCIMKRAFLKMEELGVETDTQGRDIFEICVKTEYQKGEGLNKDNLILNMKYDEASKGWIVDSFKICENTDGELKELQ